MSWSFSAIGRAAAVAKKIREASENGGKPYCKEPEETIRKQTLETLALAADGNAGVIKVEASGSMQWSGDVATQNNVVSSLQPIYGFVE